MRFGVWLLGLTLLAPLPARAQSKAAPAAANARAETPKDCSWFSVGAGLGIGLYDGTGLLLANGRFGLGTLAPGYTPFGVALVEAKLSTRVRLALGLNAAYQKTDHRDDRPDPTNSSYYPREQSTLGAAVGLRWVLNPGGVVEASPLLSVGAHRGTAKGMQSSYVPESDTEPAHFLTADATGYGVDARVGLVLEYELMSQLYLRFESSLLGVGYDHMDAVTRADTEQHERLKQTTIGLTVQPSLQLRLAF